MKDLQIQRLQVVLAIYFTYKSLKLNVFITYSFGNVVRLDPAFHNKYSDLDATPKEFKNRWVNSGEEKIHNYSGYSR